MSWQTFTALAYQVAEERGNGAESLDDGQRIVSIASDLWQEDKQRLGQMSRAEALDYLRRNA